MTEVSGVGSCESSSLNSSSVAPDSEDGGFADLVKVRTTRGTAVGLFRELKVYVGWNNIVGCLVSSMKIVELHLRMIAVWIFIVGGSRGPRWTHHTRSRLSNVAFYLV